MKQEPVIDKPAVLHTLQREYGLSIQRITFMNTGWASYIYKAEASTGASYLLKLYDESLPEPLLATSREFYLPLTHQLHAKGLLTQIAYPVQSRDGMFSMTVGRNRIILFHFIEGDAVGFGGLPDEILVKLAGLVGRLHRSTAALELVSPLVEDFRIAFDEALPTYLCALEGDAPDNRPGWDVFRDLLVPRRDQILGYLRRLREFQGMMRSRPRQRVICHTDLHGGNLLLSRTGELYIVDWEGAMLAPPEQDLFFFAADDTFRSLFWPNYLKEFPAATLDVDALGFYFYRRGLEDLAEWLQRLMHAEQTEEQVRNALHWAARTVDGLGGTERTLEKLRGT